MTEQDDLIPVGIDEGLHVYLSPRLQWRHVSAIKWEILVAREKVGTDLPPGEIIGILQEGYLTYGIARWDLDKPLTRESIQSEILNVTERASIVVEKADELYSEQVLLPLVMMGVKSSQATSTNGSTSATTGSPPKRTTRSKRSSTSISPTDAIERTASSPDGDSSS